MSSTVNEDNSSHTTRVADMLPELPDEAIQDASQDDSVEWAQGMLEYYPPGTIHERCISVYDHGYCRFMLQMVITTFNQAGLTLEVDPHTVLRPYEASEEQEPRNEVPQTTIDEAFAIEVV